MEFIIRRIFGERVVFRDGVVCYATAEDVEIITGNIFWQMPRNHTLFKDYDPEKRVWTIEIYSGPRDHKTSPVWRGEFRRIYDDEIASILKESVKAK